jgi:Tol biopolymer transport system component
VVDGSNPLTISIGAASPITISFQVSCAAVPALGRLVVRVTTSGSSRDQDGYYVLLDSLPARALQTDDTVTFVHLSTGTHEVRLDGVAGSCEVREQNPRRIEMSSDSTETSFEVSCWPAVRGTIAFTREEFEAGRRADLFLVRADGIGLLRLTDTPDIAEAHAAWSPDGATVAFDAQALDADGHPVGEPSIQLIRREGGLGSSVAGGTNPIWSPDGGRLLFFSEGIGWQVIDLITGQVRRLPFGSPSWAPDGKHIALTRPSEGLTTVVIVDRAGANPKTMARIPVGVDTLVWSPDGARFGLSTGAGLAVIDTSGSGPLLEVTSDDATYDQVSWSPDGTTLLFLKTEAGAEFEERDVYTLRVSDLATTRLTPTSGPYESPIWSTDGSRVLYASDEDYPFLGSMNLFVVNADGTGLRHLTAGGARNEAPSWGR